LAFVSSQRGLDLEQFVHEFYSVDRFRAAYCREVEPMTDKTQWPRVELPFVVGAPLAKGEAGRRRKLRLKGFMEGGHKKKAPKHGDSSTKVGGANGGDNGTAPNQCKGSEND